MKEVAAWITADLDGEVLDRVDQVLAGRAEHLHSPHAALQPAWDPRSPAYGGGREHGGMGMST
jgi:hypothetical protein